jgi:hypothetical protein
LRPGFFGASTGGGAGAGSRGGAWRTDRRRRLARRTTGPCGPGTPQGRGAHAADRRRAR